jgi:hypothetical protein
MMLLGILWAVFAPLGLLLPFWLILQLLRKARLPERFAQGPGLAQPGLLRGAFAAALVLLPVAFFWYQDHSDFRAVCQTFGAPRITRTSQADGFFLDDATANSFGMRYLQEDGFKWLEARSIYQRDEFVRYEISIDGKISETRQQLRTARFAVVSEFSQPKPHTRVTFTRVIDSAAPDGAQELARSALVHFSGGRMSAVLGVYASASCPSARSDTGAWSEAYHLARNTLGTKR